MFSFPKALLTAVFTMTAASFKFRAYSNGTCNSSSPGPSTFPPINVAAIDGGEPKICYSNPIGTDWNAMEVDSPGDYAVFTYCNVGCQGGYVVNFGGTCFPPPEGCAIGSFWVDG